MNNHHYELFLKWFITVIIPIFITLFGWSMTISNRITVQETRMENVETTLNEVRADVKELLRRNSTSFSK